uniref:Reverse transcriptase domain-containing protein n=1 Tax=Trichogramma kaykai TaxID=54128 RepID=A0ABD2WNT4_9HYME
MSNKTSSAWDEVPNIILKKLNNLCIRNYTIIFSNCTNNGYYPDIWKTAKLIVINKKPDQPTELDNLRPISMLPCISKIYERLIKNNILKFNNKHNIIPEHQFGFREGHSTIHAIQKLTADINWEFNRGNMTGAILVDLQKAFDSVWHHGLLFKLIKNNMDPHLLKLTYNLITNRKFKLTNNDTTNNNKTFTITKGLQQGTVNSPFLFNLYTADVTKSYGINKNTTNALTFADDLILYTSNNNMKTIEKNLQSIYNRIVKLYKDWKLKVNPSKCETILFRNNIREEKHHTQKNWRNFQIKDIINNTVIPHKRQVKYLGIIFDDLLRFNIHVKLQLKKASNAFKTLHNLFYTPHLGSKAKIICYQCLIRPLLTYGCPIWYNMSVSAMEKLRLFERKILRACLNKYRTAESNYKKRINNFKILEMAMLPRIDTFIIYLIRNYIRQAISNKSNSLIFGPYYHNNLYLINALERGKAPPEAFKFLDDNHLIIDDDLKHCLFHIPRNNWNKSLPLSIFNKNYVYCRKLTSYDEELIAKFKYYVKEKKN